jgi:predicted nucleic acid-binding protein
LTACFDSNVVIDYLQGHREARRLIGAERERHISIMTWIEVMAGAERRGDAETVRRVLGRFRVHDVAAPVAEQAVVLRNAHRLRSPDAVIWATAIHLGIPLVTRNTRDFPGNHPSIRIPYRI